MVPCAIVDVEHSGVIVGVNLDVALARDLLSFNRPLCGGNRDSSHDSWQPDGGAGLNDDALGELNINLDNRRHCEHADSSGYSLLLHIMFKKH